MPAADGPRTLSAYCGTGNLFSENISVLYGREGDAFATAVTAAAVPGAFALTSGDFNGDGWLDAAKVL